MSYSMTNLREVDDAAVKGGFSEVQEARFARGELDAESVGLGLMRVKPGKRQAFAHRHEEAEEIYVILSGSGRLKLDDDIVDVGPMDAVRVAPTVKRSFEAGDDGLEYIAFGTHHENDGELDFDASFWGD